MAVSSNDTIGVVSTAARVLVGGDRITLSLVVGEDGLDVDEECEGVHVNSGGWERC